MISGSYVTVLFVIICAYSVLSQDCIFYGRKCSNHVSCCGGCCVDNICTDTYRPCYMHGDLCLERKCPPGQECYIFRPELEGSEAYAACRESEEVSRMISP